MKISDDAVKTLKKIVDYVGYHHHGYESVSANYLIVLTKLDLMSYYERS